jgi:hypothetical protein
VSYKFAINMFIKQALNIDKTQNTPKREPIKEVNNTDKSGLELKTD